MTRIPLLSYIQLSDLEKAAHARYRENLDWFITFRNARLALASPHLLQTSGQMVKAIAFNAAYDAYAHALGELAILLAHLQCAESREDRMIALAEIDDLFPRILDFQAMILDAIGELAPEDDPDYFYQPDLKPSDLATLVPSA